LKFAVIGPVYPYRGGIAHFTTQLSKKLMEADHKVHNISFRRQYPEWLYPGKSDKDPSQPLIQLQTKYLLDPIYPWTWMNTSGEIGNLDPDLVIIPWWTTFWGPAFWTLARSLSRRGYRICFLIHNVLPHEQKPWDGVVTRAVLRLGDAHVVQSQNEYTRLLELLPDSEPVLCPHPVYNQFRSHPEINRDLVFQLQGLDEDLPVLLFFGIVRQYKGLKFLIEALSILKTSGITVQLIIAGEFWENIEHYEDMLIRMGLHEQVFLFDRYIPDEEVSIFFDEADVFVAPYIDGTQSGSVKIALSFGLPCVVTESISDDLIEESDRVVIVPPGNSQALADGIKALIDAGLPAKKEQLKDDSSWDQLISTIEGIMKASREN
jgi:glycosyltransferase involved in cell wall biosynthesis